MRPFLGRLTFAATGKKPGGKLKFGSLHPSWPPPLGRLHGSLHPKCGGEALSFPWPPLRVSSKFPPLLWGMLHLETTALCLVRTGDSPKLVLFLNSAFFKIREGGRNDLPKDKASQGQRWLRSWYLDSARGFFQYNMDSLLWVVGRPPVEAGGASCLRPQESRASLFVLHPMLWEVLWLPT